MAKYEGEIFGEIRGRVGGYTGAKWRSIRYVRKHQSRPSNPRTVPQVLQRGRFSVAGLVARVLLPAAQVGYRWGAKARKTTQFGSLVKQIVKEALKPDGLVDPARVRVANGPGYPLEGLAVAKAGADYKATWATVPGEVARTVYAIAWDGASTAVRLRVHTADESTGEMTIPALAGTGHVYVFAADARRHQCSPSQHFQL